MQVTRTEDTKSTNQIKPPTLPIPNSRVPLEAVAGYCEFKKEELFGPTNSKDQKRERNKGHRD